MEKKDLINIIDSILKPLCFKRKGNYWKFETSELIKILNIQKSNYSNLFYIYFGFNIKGFNDDKFDIHVYMGLSSEVETENNYIMKLLDFESQIDEEERWRGITKIIYDNILEISNNINELSDLKKYILKSRQMILQLPETVIHYLNLENELNSILK